MMRMIFLAKALGNPLKKMTPQQKALAEMKIQQLMYEIHYCNVQPTPYFPLSDNPMY